MAEARREDGDEGERGELRELRSRGQATDHPERTKSEYLHSSQGPLSSIRAAIKRTRANSQCEHTRDRRRPEITIVAAEPLAANNWFPGASVVFPPPQAGWSSGLQPVSQPPPSYDQVIQEKTQEEQTVKPTAAPRRLTCTTTCATQTDPVRADATTTTTTVPQSAEKRPDGKTPQKPPRPSLPKPVNKDPVTASDRKVGSNATTSTNTDNQSASKSDVEQRSQADPTHTCTRSVTVHWDIPAAPPSAPAAPTEATPSQNSDSELCQRPVPLPRTKSRKQATAEEVKAPDLVELSENCEGVLSDPEEISSNKYLKELLEVFSAENQWEEDGDIVDQSDEASQGDDAVGEMNSNGQRNIRARIQAFESQASTDEAGVAEPVKPDCLPRKPSIKPPVAAKPTVAVKPRFNHSADDYQNISSVNVSQDNTPAQRPEPPKKPVGMSVKKELEILHSKAANSNRSRPSVLTRANSIDEEEPLKKPPVPPVKPPKEPLKPNLNINNHNSASIPSEHENKSTVSDHIPVKPQRNVDSNGGLVSKPSVSRRPTTIRVPSKTGSDTFQDSPPPLPAQKPVGTLKSSIQKQNTAPTLPSQASLQFGSEPLLPPRTQTPNKVLPPRPPPAKTGPGRPPPPKLKTTGRSVSAPDPASKPKPKAQKPHRKGLVLPPRPNPGHRLYNKYTLELPHGIAALDYNGSNTGELSFQKNEVLLLLEEINRDTFECQVGDAKGRVHKSHMKVITPLSSDVSPPQGGGPSASGHKQNVKVIHDFIPEGPGELALRAGDIVTGVEKVDNEWYRGNFRGSSGFFPVNFVQVLPDSPKTLPKRKPKPPSTVSGPRCMARFDFEGEHSDELSFSEGDVIQLKEYIGQEWARGQVGVSTGIFPLNFVEVIEDLPLPPSQQKTPTQPGKVALPGMAASSSACTEVSKPAQTSQAKVVWVVALYDYAGKSEEDLSFQKGDCILITQRINDEWSSGRLNGREGMFPTAFVESSTAGQQPQNSQNKEAAGGQRARALYNFTSDCDEELSLQMGDIITNLEAIDEEWFLGDLRGKRALVPKNYVQVL